MTDNKIINLILEGDKEKVRLIVEKYQQMVFRTCIGFLQNKDDANDLIQDIFIQA
jgi:RNA polymerase sigma-70 factor (ECF subfamily)